MLLTAVSERKERRPGTREAERSGSEACMPAPLLHAAAGHTCCMCLQCAIPVDANLLTLRVPPLVQQAKRYMDDVSCNERSSGTGDERGRRWREGEVEERASRGWQSESGLDWTGECTKSSESKDVMCAIPEKVNQVAPVSLPHVCSPLLILFCTQSSKWIECASVSHTRR